MTNPAAANSVSTILGAAAADRRRADARIVLHKSRYREPFLSISLVTVTPLSRNVYSQTILRKILSNRNYNTVSVMA